MKRLLMAVLLFAAVPPAHAQNQPDPNFERVLVPVYFFGGGTFGAQWWTDLNLMNTGPDLTLGEPVLQGNPACENFCGCDVKATLPQNSAATSCQQFESVAGFILYVPRNADRDDVHIAARGRDRSRASDRYGSEIPVVWERDLLDGTMVLLDIPTDPGYRTALRLYDAFQWTTRFTVRFYDTKALRRHERTALAETTVTVSYSATPRPNVRPMQPAFAYLGDLASTYPALRAVSSVTIEIEPQRDAGGPERPEKRFYALASITNNTTQELTIVSPR